jgi:putative flippase GtrA
MIPSQMNNRENKKMDPCKNTIRQVCRYGISGGTGACIDFGLYSLIISFTSLNYLLANAISFSLGTLAVYYLQKNWTFHYQSEKSAIVFTKFLAVVLVTYILNNLILIICVEFLHMNPLIAKAVQIGLSFIWGYTSNKKFVFT